MIIEAKNTYGDGPIDVVISPFDVLCEMSKDWRISLGLQSFAPILGGYWMRHEHDETNDTGRYIRERLATREEILQMDAFKLLTDYAAYLD